MLASFVCPSLRFNKLCLLILSISKLIWRGETAGEKCGIHLTDFTACFTTPNKSKSNQHPMKESASKKMHSAEGAQKSYCSDKREEKENRECEKEE